MKFTDEEKAQELVVTIEVLQELQRVAWEMGYTKGANEPDNVFDLAKNPWSEENDDY